MRLGKRPALTNKQQGIALVALLVALLVLGLAAQRVAFVISDNADRERAQASLMLGTLYAQAIKSYYEASPGTVKQYPQRLEDLLEDKRYVYIKRHLRKPYKDPLAQDADFELLFDANGRIKGVQSAPTVSNITLAVANTEGIEIVFSESTKSWQFIFVPPIASPVVNPSVGIKVRKS